MATLAVSLLATVLVVLFFVKRAGQLVLPRWNMPTFTPLTLIGHSSKKRKRTAQKIPVSVNYHFSRVCNMACGFCFHTESTSYRASIVEGKRGIKLLKDAGMRKINFAGGEPFLYERFLGEMIAHSKAIGVECVSIVSNGSRIRRSFLERHGADIDILAVSCDSFDEATNVQIGRGTGDNVAQLHRVKAWCDEFGIQFKLNTVVCNLNWEEDMNAHVAVLRPVRWKCFQVLIVQGENDSDQRLRDGRKYCITDEQFSAFIDRHKEQDRIVPEPNNLMAKSYLILDEYLRFLDRDGGDPSASILDVGVEQALQSVVWDEDSFEARGGVYDWRREDAKPPGQPCGTAKPDGVDW